MKKYTITLNEEELSILKDALNSQDVLYYQKKIDKAKKAEDKFAEKFWQEEWNKNLDLFCKLVKTTMNEEEK